MEGVICMQKFLHCTTTEGKLIWPDLLGKKGKEATDVIEKARAHTDAIYVPQDAVVTADYCCNLVRIFVDGSNDDYGNAKVIVVPRVGWSIHMHVI
jgi:hypothetical protein